MTELNTFSKSGVYYIYSDENFVYMTKWGYQNKTTTNFLVYKVNADYTLTLVTESEGNGGMNAHYDGRYHYVANHRGSGSTSNEGFPFHVLDVNSSGAVTRLDSQFNLSGLPNDTSYTSFYRSLTSRGDYVYALRSDNDNDHGIQIYKKNYVTGILDNTTPTDSHTEGSMKLVIGGREGKRIYTTSDGHISGSAGSIAYFSQFNDDGTSINVPDYVFEPDYKLKTLEEFGIYIKENKHMPGIPDQNDIQSWKGLSMGDRDMLMLEKIEELSLYILQLHERIKKLEEK